MKSNEEEKRALLQRGNSLVGSSSSSATATLNATLQRKNSLEALKSDPIPEEEEKDEKGSTLIVAFVLMLFFQLGNRIFGRLQTYPMHNYPLFLNMVMVAIYIPICFVYVIPVILFTSNISKEQRAIPKYKFAVMGAYDSLAGIMQTFAVNYISNASMIVLVQQSAIPISMAISRYALNSVYSKAQYIGASVVLLGIVVVLIPSFFDTSSAAASASSSELMWIMLLVALGETEIDIMYLNGWVAIFQFLIAIPLCLPSAAVQNMPPGQILPNIRDGMKCWMGINSITPDSNPLNQRLDDCSSAPVYVTTYLFFNVVYNFLIIVILKLGSANIMWMASTVIVPLSNVAFSIKFMPGSQPLRFWDLIGLVVIMSGLVIYRFNAALLSVWQRITGKQAEAPVETELEKKARKIAKTAESHQIKYLGINQTEYLQSLVDTRVAKEQMVSLYRSPQQIRGSYLAKVGVPPSPLISMGPGNRPVVDRGALSAARASYQSTGYSPMLSGSLQRSMGNKGAMLGSPASKSKFQQEKANLASEV